MDVNLKAGQFDWETYDGETTGTTGDYRWEVTISARPTAKDIRWGAQDTNVRTWDVRDLSGQIVAKGEADGVRACKTAALAAINEIIDDIVFRAEVAHFEKVVEPRGEKW